MDLINIPLWKNEKEGRCPSSGPALDQQNARLKCQEKLSCGGREAQTLESLTVF